MSRSRRKPYSGVCCGTDTLSHILETRRYRRAFRSWLYQVRIFALDSDAQPYPIRLEYSEPYNWPTDGGNSYHPPHCCTPECDLVDFERKWCERRRAWDAKLRRK
jgi:hypothetical protein